MYGEVGLSFPSEEMCETCKIPHHTQHTWSEEAHSGTIIISLSSDILYPYFHVCVMKVKVRVFFSLLLSPRENETFWNIDSILSFPQTFNFLLLPRNPTCTYTYIVRVVCRMSYVGKRMYVLFPSLLLLLRLRIYISSFIWIRSPFTVIHTGNPRRVTSSSLLSFLGIYIL